MLYLSTDTLWYQTKPDDYGRDANWDTAKESIERNHVAGAPEHWREFLASIREHGVKKPITIARRGGVWRVTQGHHRVWGAESVGRYWVPVKLASAEDLRRERSLLVGGHPKWVRCYDNEGASADCYTEVYTGRYRTPLPADQHRHYGRYTWYQYLSMSGSPFHPQGVGMHGENREQIDVNKSGFAPAMGRRCHLGKRIPFSELPFDCQRLAWRDYSALWMVRVPKQLLG